MRIQLICVGSRMPDWIEKGFYTYSKRLVYEIKLQLVEIPLGRRGKGVDVNRLREKEARQMIAAVGQGDRVINLDVGGRQWKTEQLVDAMKNWLRCGYNLSLLVGGPEGLHPSCVALADSSWSLSPLTLPHPLVRVVIAEQLYRAWSILHNHPYHK